MDWLLTVPLLLIEIILVMKLSPEETTSKAITLGGASALMIIIGYPGELLRNDDNLGSRWMYWAGAMVPFNWDTLYQISFRSVELVYLFIRLPWQNQPVKNNRGSLLEIITNLGCGINMEQVLKHTPRG